MKLRLPLLINVVLTLAMAALLPLGISFYQLRSNEDSLFSQVRRTHVVAAAAAARQADAYVESMQVLAQSLATHPVLLSSPHSVSSQELLRGTLQAQPSVVAIGIYSLEGEEVILAQRIDLRDEIGEVYQPQMKDLDVLDGIDGRWLRLRQKTSNGEAYLVLISDALPLEDMVQVEEAGEELQLMLFDRGGDKIAGIVDLDAFPQDAVERARLAKTQEAVRYEDERVGATIVGYAQLRLAPWAVLTRQPAEVAEVAETQIRAATRVAAASALLLTSLLSVGAYLSVIRPIRRLAQAQQELLGEDVKVEGVSEIEQLEASFKALQQRLADSEDLSEVFLGRYQVEHLVGSGAMGSVFRGWDPKLQRPVALKTIRMNAEDLDREKLVKSLLSEAALSARFNHSNIVTVYDMADTGNSAFIAMEFVKGVSLDAYLWDRGTLTPAEAIPLGASMARALAVAHSNGLVHHDVKPANVLLGDDDMIKVTDFGISQLITSAVKVGDVICGTPGYLAPEALMGEGYTPQSDLFSLGLILYEAMVGKHPFFGRNIKETMLNTIMEEAPPIETVVPQISPEFASLVTSLLAKEPGDRPSNAEAVAQALEEMTVALGLRWTVQRETMKNLETGEFETRTHTQLISLPERHAIKS